MGIFKTFIIHHWVHLSYIMDSRLDYLQHAVDGYTASHILLVATDGKTFQPAGFTDDLGIYLFVPLIKSLLHINLELAIQIFFAGILMFTLIVGFIGCFLYYKNKYSRIIALAYTLILTILAYEISDVYIAYLVPLSLLPLFLYFYKRNKTDKYFILFLIFSGILIGFFNLIRGNSGTALLIFIILNIVFCYQKKYQEKLYLISSIILGIILVNIFLQYSFSLRNNYLQTNNPNFDVGSATNAHPFWHQIYIGFGFLTNPYNIVYSDEISFNKAKSINPNVVLCSAEYEKILKKETLLFIFKHPVFTINTFFAKIGVLLFYALIFFNIGFYFIIKQKGAINISFLAAILFTSIFSILVIPTISFALPFIVFVSLYNVYLIDKFFQQR